MFNGESFIVYGVGPRSELLIKTYGEQVLGLMDRYMTGEIVFGKPVLSERQASLAGAKKIVIAARAANVKIISRRIHDFCTENGIAVHDAKGNALTIETPEPLENSLDRLLTKYGAKASNKRIIEGLASGVPDTAAFVAPIIYCFMDWICGQAKSFDLLLFCSRDGFLPHMINERIKRYNLPARYFLTSRTAAVSAGLFTKEDIGRAAAYPFSGTPDEMKQARFNVPAGAQEKEILEKSKALRENYLNYIKTLGISPKDRIALVDLVSAGTCLKWLSRFAGFSPTGLFFAKLGGESINAASMFDVDDIYGSHFNFQNNYFLLEETMSSYQPMLRYFDEDAKPVFYEEKRNEGQIGRLKRLHEKILDYGERMADVDFSDVDIALADDIMGLCADVYTPAEDEFCGR